MTRYVLLAAFVCLPAVFSAILPDLPYQGFANPAVYPRSYDSAPVLDQELYEDLRALLKDNPVHEIPQDYEQVPHPVEAENFGKDLTVPLGQVSGVAVNPDGNPVLLHRGSRVWDSRSFDANARFLPEGPITEDTVLVLDADTGNLIKSWGANKFFMPHGISIDKDGNTWITDTGLHQVLKYEPGKEEASLVLGTRLEPGNDKNHFCKPTDVAVLNSGDFFVSDGYCNSRLIKYSPDGKILGEWGTEKGKATFSVVHSVTVAEDKDLVCVADRENLRIQCFTAGIRDPSKAGQFAFRSAVGGLGRIFAISYGGGFLYGIAYDRQGIGFTLDPDSNAVVDTWAPASRFGEVHDVVVVPNATAVYVGEIRPNRITKFNVL